MKKSLLFIALAAALIMGACSSSSQKGREHSRGNGWGFNAKVSGLDGRKIALEQYVEGGWILIDSLQAGDDDSIVFRADSAAAFPDVYRLALGDKYIFFPVDSTDVLALSTDAADFNTAFTLTGTPAADSLALAEKLIMEAGDNATRDPRLKDRLNRIILGTDNLMVAYYILYRRVNNVPLYSIRDRKDLRIIGAVANKFHAARPDDPRTATLARAYWQTKIDADPDRYGTTLDATLTGLPADVEGVATDGTTDRLSNHLGKGHPVILSFTAFGTDASALYNTTLRTALEETKDLKPEVFQVSYDETEGTWRSTASGLPWKALWKRGDMSRNELVAYNVGVLPMTFVFNSAGDLVAAVPDLQNLAAYIRQADK